MALLVFTCCGSAGVVNNGAFHTLPGYRQTWTPRLSAADRAVAARLDGLLTNWWTIDAHPCPFIQADPRSPAHISVARPGSLMGRYVYRRLTTLAPPSFSLQVLRSSPGGGSIDSPGDLSMDPSRGDAFLSLMVEYLGGSVEVSLMLLAYNQLAICLDSNRPGGQMLPIAYTTMVFEAETFTRLALSSLDNAADDLSGGVSVLRVRIIPSAADSPGVFDRMPEQGAASVLPDLSVCLSPIDSQNTDDFGQTRCSPVAWDRMELSDGPSLSLRPGQGFVVAARNIDRRGNVPYPPESQENATLATLRFRSVPVELLLQGIALFQVGPLEMELIYTLDEP